MVPALESNPIVNPEDFARVDPAELRRVLKEAAQKAELHKEPVHVIQFTTSHLRISFRQPLTCYTDSIERKHPACEKFQRRLMVVYPGGMVRYQTQKVAS